MVVTSFRSVQSSHGSDYVHSSNNRILTNGEEPDAKKQRTCSSLFYDLKDSLSLTDKIFLQAIKGKTSIEEITLSHGYNELTDLSLQGLQNQVGGGLTCLALHSAGKATAKALGVLVASSENLRNLNLSCCLQVNEDFLKAWGGKLLSRLEVLKLRACESIKDDVAAGIVSLCPNLQELDLEECEQCTDSFLLSLAAQTNGIAKSLKKISLGWWPLLTDRGAEIVALSIPNLTELNLRYCPKVTDNSVGKIASSLNDLVDLNLSFCSITDGTFSSLSEDSLPNLKKLNLSGTSITNETVKKLANMTLASQLEELSLSRCEKIDGQVLKWLTSFPKLKSLELAFVNLGPSKMILAPLRDCSQLEFLNLNCLRRNEFSFFTPEEIISGTEEIKQLKQLSVNGLGKKTDYEKFLSKKIEILGLEDYK